MNLNESRTKNSLMQAFAGECQANFRYIESAQKCSAASMNVLEMVFKFTAQQELAHAQVFYNYLKSMTGQKLEISADYPVVIEDDPLRLLESAVQNENEEHSPVYSDYAAIAESEGFTEIAGKFREIAGIEKSHGERFSIFADLLASQRLYVSDIEEEWLCLNCGHRLKGTQAPQSCPVCGHPQGYFIRLKLAPYTC